MEMANYISTKLAEHEIYFRGIKADFHGIDNQLAKAFKLIKRVDRTNTLLLLGGVGLLYLVAKLSSKVMALEAAANQTETEDTEEPKGE